MIEIKFAENLKNFRIASKLTQKELANMLGVNKRTVSAWENKICEPNLAIIARLCEIFNETFENLLT